MFSIGRTSAGRFRLAIVTIGFTVLGLGASRQAAAAPSIAGTWAIHGKLVTSSAMNPNDRYAPKQGQEMLETWKIVKTARGFALTTPKGTVPGTGTASSGRFKARFPASILGARCIIQVTINAKATSASNLAGSEEVLYFMYNGIGALNPVPAREAWTFSAKRKK